MADNTTLNSGSGGDDIRTLEDASSVKWPVGVAAYATSVGTPDVLTIPTAAALVDDMTNPTTLLEGACAMVWDGAGWDRMPGNSSNGVTVNLGSNNDVTLATLPDTAAGDLAAINAALAGTLTVGSHAVTNAGTFAVQVDGDALTALQLIDNIVGVADATAGATPTGVPPLAVRDDALSSLTPIEGDFVPLRTDANGALWVIPSGTVPVDGSGVTQPISAASLPLPSGAATAANQSTANTALSAIQTAVELLDNAISGTEMRVDVVASLPAGTNAIGKLAANSGVDIGDVDVTSLPSGATSHYRNIDANAEAAIKGSAGTLYWLHVINLTAALAYLHLYDATTANVTPGTTTPDYTFPIPTQGDTNGAGFVINLGALGQSFANAITLVCTTTTNGAAGDPGTNGVMVNAGYA